MVELLRRSPRVVPDGRDWQFIHFEARRLDAGDGFAGDSAGNETALVVLGGSATVEAEGQRFAINGRTDVWQRVPPSLVLLPPEYGYVLSAESSCEVVVAGAEAKVG